MGVEESRTAGGWYAHHGTPDFWLCSLTTGTERMYKSFSSAAGAGNSKPAANTMRCTVTSATTPLAYDISLARSTTKWNEGAQTGAVTAVPVPLLQTIEWRRRRTSEVTQPPTSCAGVCSLGLASALPVVVLILIVVLRLNPRFFFHDDRQSYFAGTYHYLGKSLLNGNIPFTIPWQGVAGNFVLDPQNGALNPIYWVQSLAFAQLDNLVLASTLVSTAFLLILTWGTAAWIWRLTHHAAWAAVAGSAGGLGGFALWWLATSWHPGIVSLAFLPWVGYSLAQRTPGIRATVALGVAVYCAVSTGWPFTVLAVAVLSTASLLELGLLRQWRTLAWQMVTISAGALLAAPAWIITAAALDWTARGQGIVNTFFLIPNLADVLNTAIPTATSSMNSFVSPIIGSPITYAGGFGIATLALLDWRRVDYKRTGFITITAAYATCLLLTQMPEVGPFRWAFRMIPAVALLTTVACAYLLANFGMVLTRARLVAAVLVLGVGGIVAAFRYPPWVLVQVLSILLALAFLLSLYKYLQPAARQRIRSAAIPLALVLTMSLWPFLVRPENLDIGDSGMPGRVSDYAVPLGLQSTESPALYPSQDESPVAESARQGVFFGQSSTPSPARSGVGHAPVWQRYAGTADAPSGLRLVVMSRGSAMARLSGTDDWEDSGSTCSE